MMARSPSSVNEKQDRRWWLLGEGSNTKFAFRVAWGNASTYLCYIGDPYVHV
jgi:hypothetical protein